MSHLNFGKYCDKHGMYDALMPVCPFCKKEIK